MSTSFHAPMTDDLFAFWRRLPRGKRVHPADQPILAAEKHHGFRLRLVPGYCGGALRTAPVVLCFLNPGYDGHDVRVATDPRRRARMFRQLGGRQPYPLWHPGAEKWFASRVSRIGGADKLQRRVAVFNLLPYHSRQLHSTGRRLASVLPSAHVARRYLHDVLIPAAQQGRRFIIIARASALWGIHPTMERRNLKVLTNRGGHIPAALAADIKKWLQHQR